jgi:hypothetical protein
MKKALVVVSMLALASASYGLTLAEGTKEIGVSGGFDPDTAVGQDFKLAGMYGQFIRDNWEVGVIADVFDNDLGTLWGIGAGTEYNFDLGSPFVPYLGLGVLWEQAEPKDLDSTDTAVGKFSAGVKYFAAENIAVFAAVNVRVAADDIFVNDEDGTVEDNDYNIEWGMRFYLPTK